MGDPLFNRDIAVTVGPLQILPRDSSGAAQPILKMQFKITKTLDSTPNKASLSIWNLNDSSRSKVQEKNIDVVIEAGYLGFTSQLFKGTMDFATTAREETEWITKLEAGDGSKEMKTARINESFKAGTKAGGVLKKLAKTLGLDEGNLDEAVSTDGARSILKEWVSGKVLSGKSTDVMDDITKSLGLDWSVQDKKLQVLSKGIKKPGKAKVPKGTTKDPAIVLNPGSGLIGSPEVGEDGVVKAKSLMNGKLFPGRRVTLDALQVTGDYRIDSVIHDGDTWGNNWYSDLELSPA